MQDASLRGQSIGTVLVLVLVGAILAVRGFGTSSLWLDETVTSWIVQGSLGEAFDRAYRLQGQSPLYYVILWGWAQSVGVSDVALRMPSLLALVATLSLVFFWCRRKVGLMPSALAVAVLLAIDPFVIALSARSYACGLLSVVAGLIGIDRGLEEQRPRWVWWGSLLLALGCYFHFLFALAFLVVPMRAGYDVPKLWRPLGMAAILCVPLIGQILSLAMRSKDLLFIEGPSVSDLVTVIFPLPAMIQIGIGAAVLLLVPRGVVAGREQRPPAHVFWERGRWILGWWIGPPLVLWCLALMGIVPFAGRYVLFSSVGTAVFIAFIVRLFLTRKGQRVIFAAVATLVLVRSIERTWRIEDWRGAFAEVQSALQCNEPGKTLLLYSGLVELENQSWRLDKQMRDYLNAPSLRYASKLSVMPIGLSSQFKEELGDISGVCGVVLLRRSLPPQARHSLQSEGSSEEILIQALQSAGLLLERVTPEGALVAVYRVAAVEMQNRI